MLVKKHTSHDGKVLLAICDSVLFGKSFEEGDAFLDLTNPFYQGEKVDDKELESMIESANTVNVVGKKSVEFLRKIVDFATKTVQGVPHAMIVFERE